MKTIFTSISGCLVAALVLAPSAEAARGTSLTGGIIKDPIEVEDVGNLDEKYNQQSCQNQPAQFDPIPCAERGSMTCLPPSNVPGQLNFRPANFPHDVIFKIGTSEKMIEVSYSGLKEKMPMATERTLCDSTNKNAANAVQKETQNLKDQMKAGVSVIGSLASVEAVALANISQIEESISAVESALAGLRSVPSSTLQCPNDPVSNCDCRANVEKKNHYEAALKTLNEKLAANQSVKHQLATVESNTHSTMENISAVLSFRGIKATATDKGVSFVDERLPVLGNQALLPALASVPQQCGGLGGGDDTLMR